MNKKLIKMNEKETLALLEALSTNKTANQKHLKKIEAKRSETQQILKKQSQRFSSVAQKMESISDSMKENIDTSTYNLKRSQRIIHAS